MGHPVHRRADPTQEHGILQDRHVTLDRCQVVQREVGYACCCARPPSGKTHFPVDTRPALRQLTGDFHPPSHFTVRSIVDTQYRIGRADRQFALIIHNNYIKHTPRTRK